MKLLDEWHIGYQRFDHPAVFTCEQAAIHLKGVPGAGTKNLFLVSEKQIEPCLLMVDEAKRVDINRLGKQLGLGKLRFGSPEKMEIYLGVEPGSVTVLAIINDMDRRVRLLIDRDLWQKEKVQCHPLVNTATLVISIGDLQTFFDGINHTFELVEIPTRETA